jgi:hypothetical protein
MTNEAICSMCQGGKSLALCERCAKNLEMLDLAQALEELPTRTVNVGNFSFEVSPAAPPDTIYFVPKREALEHALEHDEAPDLRRYFGVIKNIGS